MTSAVISAIRQTLADAGFSPLAISASLARISAESSFNPNAVRKDDAGPGKDSFGFFQWNRDRLSNLRAFAKINGTSPSDPVTQAKFYAAEVKGQFGKQEGFYGRKLLNAQTPQQAADAAISLARPRGWSPDNPSGALGYKKTLNLTNRFLGGDYNVPVQPGNGDSGVSNRSYVAGPDRLSGTDAPSTVGNLVSSVDPKANNGMGVVGGNPVQGPPIPPSFFNGGSTDSPAASDHSHALAGLLYAIGQGLQDQRENNKAPRNRLFEDAMNDPVRRSPMVDAIRALIRI